MIAFDFASGHDFRYESMMLKNPRGEERMVIPCCGSQHG
jgi:hypothetical protein